MRVRTLALLALLTATFPVALSRAEKTAALKPVLMKPEKVALEEAFSGDKLPANWLAVKGTWQVSDGVLTGQEKKEDMHAAVLNCAVPNRDSAIQFSFKLEGADALHLSLNHANGHLFRVIVTPTGVTINKDKDKKNPASKPEALARAKAEFAPGTWHTMLVEIQGEQVSVQTDGGLSLKASHASLATDKPNYRFIVQGASVQLDDVRITTAAK
jgi:hypothetical protein